jgi:hypothetical protein
MENRWMSLGFFTFRAPKVGGRLRRRGLLVSVVQFESEERVGDAVLEFDEVAEDGAGPGNGTDDTEHIGVRFGQWSYDVDRIPFTEHLISKSVLHSHSQKCHKTVMYDSKYTASCLKNAF